MDSLTLSHEDQDGRNDPAQRFALYRLCPGVEREKELLATCATPEALGVAIVTLAREGELEVDGQPCRVGVLDRQGEKNHKWLIRPWEASPRNVSDAASTLARSRKGKA